jgi:hypothetical protein
LDPTSGWFARIWTTLPVQPAVNRWLGWRVHFLAKSLQLFGSEAIAAQVSGQTVYGTGDVTEMKSNRRQVIGPRPDLRGGQTGGPMRDVLAILFKGA